MLYYIEHGKMLNSFLTNYHRDIKVLAQSHQNLTKKAAKLCQTQTYKQNDSIQNALQEMQTKGKSLIENMKKELTQQMILKSSGSVRNTGRSATKANHGSLFAGLNDDIVTPVEFHL